ncbi:hypothetical protein [Glycomyces arizonensis]|uniref:hypothetical protein n=1 Tax=Glycomyces arizonensis TaxID=256035 RepID=UPI0009FED316
MPKPVAAGLPSIKMSGVNGLGRSCGPGTAPGAVRLLSDRTSIRPRPGPGFRAFSRTSNPPTGCAASQYSRCPVGM